MTMEFEIEGLEEEAPMIMGFKTNEASSSSDALKVLVGARILGLPYTFKKIGWVMGYLLIISIATLDYYCMMFLVYSKRKVESQSEAVKISSFGDLRFAVCGSVSRIVVDAMAV
ncbi:hypothetical protein FXO38_12297 [Capsicum annuum]|uniref:Amino acid transporter transmembrane domain-containing protein n=1 Tax=Capsicum annuum TaxID=4072 RepID=A0A2G2XYW0_CAPAN|nr:hypothetical protein FXO37_25620 [Capsicum annuum]KAF3660128.1 hypothetical protein FXO38_12297 [Capsicum annuum]PHT62660.1 hypothetical protein T459_33498 [Capsicum annuum]